MDDGSEKYSRIIFTDPGYSLLTIGWMFLGILVIWLLNNLFLLPLLLSMGGLLGSSAMLLTTLNNLLLFILVPYLYFRRRYIDNRIFTGVNARPDNRSIFLCAALAIGALMLTQVLQYFWALLLQGLGMEYSQPTTLPDGFAGFVAGLLFIAVAPAISEEYLFRGVLMRSMQGIYGTTKAIFISAGLFSLMHMSLSSLPTTFIVGLVLGYALAATNSLKLCILMHFVHNGAVVVLSLFNNGVDAAGELVYDAAALPSMFIYGGVGVFIVAITMLLLRRKGPVPGGVLATRAALPRGMGRDLLPFLIAALLMLCRIVQISL